MCLTPKYLHGCLINLFRRADDDDDGRLSGGRLETTPPKTHVTSDVWKDGDLVLFGLDGLLNVPVTVYVRKNKSKAFKRNITSLASGRNKFTCCYYAITSGRKESSSIIPAGRREPSGMI